jgi:hypothetical protein
LAKRCVKIGKSTEIVKHLKINQIVSKMFYFFCQYLMLRVEQVFINNISVRLSKVLSTVSSQ